MRWGKKKFSSSVFFLTQVVLGVMGDTSGCVLPEGNWVRWVCRFYLGLSDVFVECLLLLMVCLFRLRYVDEIYEYFFRKGGRLLEVFSGELVLYDRLQGGHGNGCGRWGG